jgi:hypothetical protein
MCILRRFYVLLLNVFEEVVIDFFCLNCKDTTRLVNYYIDQYNEFGIFCILNGMIVMVDYYLYILDIYVLMVLNMIINDFLLVMRLFNDTV